MAYERSLITESPTPTQSQPQMREERVISPYADNTRLAKAQEAVGQRNIDSGAVKGAEEAVPPAETVTLSPQMAALARKEQRFRREQQDLKARATALDAERAEIAELKALKAKLAAKDFSGIEDLVKYDDYTNYLIEKTSGSTPEQEAVRKLAAEVDGIKKSHSEDVSKRFEAAINERRKAVTQLVESNEEYSSIKELKLQEAVVQHILDTWENDGIDLSPEEAAKEVEKELIERAGKWTALSKLKPKEDATAELKQLPPLKPQIKTLTNNMSVSGEVKRPVKSLQFMTQEERYAEARRRAEEKLKAQGRI